MAVDNIYCTVDQFKMFYDERTIAELSGDANLAVEVTATIEMHLDTAASELDSFLTGRYGTPQTTFASSVPRILTRWVAVRAMDTMFGRRTKLPEAVQKDIDWADKWKQGIIDMTLSIPGYSRPRIEIAQASSGQPTRSRFDRIHGFDRSFPDVG